jgi:hypothetical protein
MLNKQIAHKFFEVFNNRDSEAMANLLGNTLSWLLRFNG